MAIPKTKISSGLKSHSKLPSTGRTLNNERLPATHPENVVGQHVSFDPITFMSIFIQSGETVNFTGCENLERERQQQRLLQKDLAKPAEKHKSKA